MLRVLVVDSDTAALNERLRASTGLRTGEGYAEALLACRPDLKVSHVAPYDGAVLPDLQGLDGVVFTGSGVVWRTDEPQAKPLAVAMEHCFAAGLPVLGSCNGMQLAATVLGGSNRASPNGREDGLARNVRLTDAGQKHPFLKGRSDGYAVPCVHRDEVESLPDGAVLLASNTHSAVQAFAYEQGNLRFWGVQYHPEYSLPFIGQKTREWKRLPDDESQALERAHQDPDAAALFGVRFDDMQDHARLTEIRNWLDSL